MWSGFGEYRERGPEIIDFELGIVATTGIEMGIVGVEGKMADDGVMVLE